MKNQIKTEKFIITSLAILVITFGSLGAYFYITLTKTNETLDAEIANLKETLTQTKEALNIANTEKTDLANNLEVEKERVNNLAENIEDISGTVGTLEKLSKTDKELLQKYSKVYFLNEHYIPPRLTKIDSEFVSPKDKSLQFHSEVYPHLKDLLENALEDDVTIKVASAYRSFGEQTSLKSTYKFTYGAGGANAFSADQGYSEHQLGTTVDFTTPDIGGTLTGFDKTEAYKWLESKAYRYGFILSYPPNNQYYQYEPWHWRYVGIDLARKLHKENKHFYDIDQREIDKYLVNIFD